MIRWIDVPVEVRLNSSTVEVIIDGTCALLVEKAKSVTIIAKEEAERKTDSDGPRAN